MSTTRWLERAHGTDPEVSECAALVRAARSGDAAAAARCAGLFDLDPPKPDRNARRRAARAAARARVAAERDARLTDWLERALPWIRGRSLQK